MTERISCKHADIAILVIEGKQEALHSTGIFDFTQDFHHSPADFQIFISGSLHERGHSVLSQKDEGRFSFVRRGHMIVTAGDIVAAPGPGVVKISNEERH